MTTWIVILAVGLGSLAFRLGPMMLLQRVTLPESGDRAIRHAGTAAISALIAISAKQTATGSAVIPTVLAVAAAVVLAARGASMLLLLICGGAIYAGSVLVVSLLAR
jgi:branched-subunit amino acid transport protein